MPNLFITENPRIVAGTELGNLAVGFIRSDGSGSNPYVLVSIADFLDSCDNPPDTLWDGYAGVTVDTGTDFSPPACYRLANDEMRWNIVAGLRDH